jgi:hypothetical protein
MVGRLDERPRLLGVASARPPESPPGTALRMGEGFVRVGAAEGEVGPGRLVVVEGRLVVVVRPGVAGA